MGLQKFAALHQGDRMRVDLADLPDPLSGQGCKDVRDPELLLADDTGAAQPQQFVVRKQAACDRVFDGCDAQQVSVGLHAGEQLVETRAGEGIDPLSVEEIAGGRVVETSGDALYGDSFHPAFGV